MEDFRELKRQEDLTSIEKVQSLNYRECFERFLLQNRPFILKENFTEKWRSRKEWQRDGKIQFDVLKRIFGDSVVPVAHCNKEKYSSHPKIEMKFADFTSYWTDHIAKNYPADNDVLYLKDWHFNKAFPEYKAYETPIFFSSDWLNEFWDSREDGECDDYRFVYMGPKGSWTPFHADVFHSYSWSANVCGKKKWILFPPGEEECLKDKFGHLVFDVTSKELDNEDMYPHFKKLRHRYEVMQESGEVIYIPSGWHHQVHNLEDTISINHNWMNGCNVKICWDFLKSSLADVEREIQDCREMEGWNQQCQVILKASAGIDIPEFLGFMELIAECRLEKLNQQHSSDKIQKSSYTEKCGDYEQDSEIDLTVDQVKENTLQQKGVESGSRSEDLMKSNYSDNSIGVDNNGTSNSSQHMYDVTRTGKFHCASLLSSLKFDTLNLNDARKFWKNSVKTYTKDESHSPDNKRTKLLQNFNPEHPLHLLFDMDVIRKIILDMMSTDALNNPESVKELERARNLLCKLDQELNPEQ